MSNKTSSTIKTNVKEVATMQQPTKWLKAFDSKDGKSIIIKLEDGTAIMVKKEYKTLFNSYTGMEYTSKQHTAWIMTEKE